MPKHQLLRQVKAKSLSVKIPKNEPNTARLSWVLANEELLTVEIPRYALERFMVQAKRAIEEAPFIPRERLREPDRHGRTDFALIRAARTETALPGWACEIRT